MSTIEILVDELIAEFEQSSTPQKAIWASNYLKNQFEFIGIDATKRKAIQKEWFKIIKEQSYFAKKWEIVFELWKRGLRELKYVAIDWMNSWKKSQLKQEDIIQFEQLILIDSWWDIVDAIASNVLGTYFTSFPNQKSIVTDKWRKDSNIWLNRSCLIFQLKYKKEVDFELLKSLIIQFQSNKEFFIQKAIGWSLRQYSKFDSESVRDFIEEIQLKGLAKREASKYI